MKYCLARKNKKYNDYEYICTFVKNEPVYTIAIENAIQYNTYDEAAFELFKYFTADTEVTILPCNPYIVTNDLLIAAWYKHATVSNLRKELIHQQKPERLKTLRLMRNTKKEMGALLDRYFRSFD